jgi:hypothetical protein
LAEGAGERAADRSEAETAARGGRAERVLRAIASIVVMGAACIGAVMSLEPLGMWADLAMVVGDLLGVGEFIGAGLLVVVLVVPVALLAGVIARPHWWAPAIAPFALGWFAWAAVILQGLAQGLSEEVWLALVLHVGCTVVALGFGLLGARMSAARVGAYLAAAFGTMWLGVLLVSACAAGGVFWQLSTGVWALTVAVEVAAFAMLLAAYWTRDPGRWWLVGIGGTLWLIGLVVIAGAAAWLGWTGELEWHVPWLLASAGAAWLGLLAFAAAAGRRWRIGGSVPFGRAVLLVGVLATVGLGAVVRGYAPGPVLSEGDPVYARLGVAPGVEVYFQFDGSGMRVARTPGALDEAEAVAAVERDGMRAVFPEVDLPVDAHELGDAWEGRQQVKARCEVRSFGASAWGRRSLEVDMMCVIGWGLVYEDEAGAEWTYWMGGRGFGAATSPDRAEAMHMPVPERPAVEVTAQVGRGGEDHVGLAIAVNFRDDLPLLEITKDGEPVEATLVVRDENGETVVTQRGTLDDLGFT